MEIEIIKQVGTMRVRVTGQSIDEVTEVFRLLQEREPAAFIPAAEIKSMEKQSAVFPKLNTLGDFLNACFREFHYGRDKIFAVLEIKAPNEIASFKAAYLKVKAKYELEQESKRGN